MKFGRIFTTLLIGALMLSACADQSNNDVLSIDASIASTSLDDSGDPVPLASDQPVVLDLAVTNNSNDEARVRHVRVVGGLMTMRVAHSNTAVDFTVDPGATRNLALELDFFDLGEQASGLVDAELQLLDARRATLATQSFTADVDGDMMSSLGLSTIMVAVFAVGSLVFGLLGVARRSLPANRFWRALQLAFTGFACGLAVMLIAPASGMWLPPIGVWAPVLLIATGAGFALGWITPGPDVADDAEDLLAQAMAA